MHFTFVQKPQLAFDIALKGVMFSEVPGLVGEMKRRLLSVITAEAVEPARVYIDMSQPFRNLLTRKQGGRQGQLKVPTTTLLHFPPPTTLPTYFGALLQEKGGAVPRSLRCKILDTHT